MPTQDTTVPKDWQVSRLGDLSESLVDGPFGSNLKTSHYVNEPGVRVVRLQNIQEGQYNDDDRAYISERYSLTLRSNEVRSGDILIAALGDDRHAVGRSCCYPPALPNAVNKADCFRLRTLPDRAENAYVMRYMNSQAARQQIRAHEQGVTRQRINLGNLRSIEVHLPPIPEQRAIVALLGTLDTIIQQTEATIDKLRQVKEGLLRDLLTHGIDADGLLRPPQSEAPHFYKDSPLGWIPKGWTAPPLASCTTWSSGGTPSRAVRSNWVGEIPLLTPKDMKSFELADTTEHVSERAAASGTRVMPPGTVFVVVRGMILAHSFPVVLSLRPMAFIQDIKAIGAGSGLLPRFLAHWFVANKELFLRKVSESTHGTKKLDTNQLLPVHLGLPPEPEQKSIVERYSALDAGIAIESEYASQLIALRSGLMDDLLTGRVRVTPLLT